MKIQGREIKLKDYMEEVYIPAGEEGGEGVLFKIGPVRDFSLFDKVCPEPQPPTKTIPGEGSHPDYTNPQYQKRLEEHTKKRTMFFMLKALEYTPELEWETINIEDPTTWEKYEDELKACGLTNPDINRLFQAVLKVNRLDPEHIRVARDRFLAMMQEKEAEDQ